MTANRSREFPVLSSRLEDLFTHKNWSTLWQTYTLHRQWEEVVGKSIAQKSEPAYIQKDTLWVYVESSVLMQHMQPQKLKLLEKINDMIPGVDILDIRWAIQPAKPVKSLPDKTRKKEKFTAPGEKEEFNAMTSIVEDTNCRKALQEFWQKYHKR